MNVILVKYQLITVYGCHALLHYMLYQSDTLLPVHLLLLR